MTKARKKYQQTEHARPTSYPGRRIFVLVILGLAYVGLVCGSVYRQVFETVFLQEEGEKRYLHKLTVNTGRGMITDRQGEPLAISTPVKTATANPMQLSTDTEQIAEMAKVLQMDKGKLMQKLGSNRGFVYLKRHMLDPQQADAMTQLSKHITGLDVETEYHRYYPSGEVTTHVVGYTNIDDLGQEGMERAYENWLKGLPGEQLVIRDGKEQVLERVENINSPKPGSDLVLSIDRRVQYLAYRELKKAVVKQRARSGSMVILDPKTGEVLAMVNYPSYNPNKDRRNINGRLRNRAITDVFEPGSTMKPFAVAAAIEQGTFKPDTPIDTNPGYLRVGRHLVKDHRNYGMLDVAGVLRKSSNVGVTKIVLTLQPEVMWNFYTKLGIGEATEANFPGEASGYLPHFSDWSEFEQATHSFGYGLSVNTLQLARAYATLANGGVRLPVSLLKLQQPPAEGVRVMRQSTARTVMDMLETVVSKEGTAPQAAISGYRVAGKTGTAKKSVAGGYADDKYLSLFVGMAPASNPRLVAAVTIDEPGGDEYYGGLVAAPVFSKVMGDTLRILNIPPDGQLDKKLLIATGRQL